MVITLPTEPYPQADLCLYKCWPFIAFWLIAAHVWALVSLSRRTRSSSLTGVNIRLGNTYSHLEPVAPKEISRSLCVSMQVPSHLCLRWVLDLLRFRLGLAPLTCPWPVMTDNCGEYCLWDSLQGGPSSCWLLSFKASWDSDLAWSIRTAVRIC